MTDTTTAPARLDRCFQALADPTRRTILERLLSRDLPISELAQPLEMSLPAVLKHVRVLESAGLVQTQKIGRARHVRLRAAPLQEATTWMNQYQAFWTERLDRLTDLLEADEEAENQDHPDNEESK